MPVTGVFHSKHCRQLSLKLHKISFNHATSPPEPSGVRVRWNSVEIWALVFVSRTGGPGTFPLVCKRVVDRSRVEKGYESLHAESWTRPPKRNNSLAAEAVGGSA